MNRDQWNAFAAREPYFAVLTHPRYLRENLDDAALADFFATGATYVVDLYHRNGISFQPRSVLEYGCGPGRLAIPFSKRAQQVVGVDVSPAMLEVARANAPGLEFLDTETFAHDTRRFDLVHCYLVLQRMHPREGLALLRTLAGRVSEGGLLVAHVPYRTSASRAVRLARSARSRVPGLNAALNVARGKDAATPFIETHVYELNDVLAVLQEAGLESPRLQLVRHGDVDGVMVEASRKQSVVAAPATAPSTALEEPRDASFIDVRELIAGTSIEDLNRTAEEYFSSLKDWEHHLAKPFAKAEDAPAMLINVATILQGLSLRPGLTVLEFGAGSGWLSRFFTQLGCEAILLDVSPTALEIAQELYRRIPVVGERPAPRFLVFDGRRIDLPDASVDRIVCFDAFHHAPDPDAALRELGRVLKPGGVAAFAEPGPHHSKSPQSQYEMRNYGVVENDVDIHALWQTAQSAGFSDLKLAAFNVPPFHVSLREFDELLAGGEPYGRWAESTRSFLQSSRTFFLRKGGEEEIDSRRADALACELDVTVSGNEVHAKIRNTGRGRWLPSADRFGGVSLGCHLYDANGKLVDLDYHWQHLPRALAPGEELTVDFTLSLPSGAHILEFDCVAGEVAWFAQVGSRPVRVAVG